MIGILNFIILCLGTILSGLLMILPPSPFNFVDHMMDSGWLANINYILPVTQVVAIMSGWLVAVGLY